MELQKEEYQHREQQLRGVSAVDSTDEPNIEQRSVDRRSPARHPLMHQQARRIVERYHSQNGERPVQENDAPFRVREKGNCAVKKPIAGRLNNVRFARKSRINMLGAIDEIKRATSSERD